MGEIEAECCRMMRADEIHARLASSWPQVLMQLGIAEATLQNKHGPCPACGGKDRFRFDNKRGRGDYICGQCGAGDGFKLLERVHGWPFSEARKRVIEAAGFSEGGTSRPALVPVRPAHADILGLAANPSERVHRLRRDRCSIENCDDAVDYLASRGLWPLPPDCTLKAHATVEYWHGGARVGRYPAIIADIVDVAGELVTCHVTYLHRRDKITDYEPRKILNAMTARTGCAVRLMPATEVLGIAEGIETALSASVLDAIPVWAALNTSLLSKFEPPPGLLRLRIYADRDEPGLTATIHLMERLQGRVALEIRIPSAPHKDWNDVLKHRNEHKGIKT
ncbi:MAG TPA: toprim domain-containing protein [Steroidobacteraceae bacterium]|nr:toprim domain-containing protein [Steroidobacteraceae bacterium]